MTKKKKSKKISKNLSELFEADAGSGFENVNDPPRIVNVFNRARKIKSWKEFIYYADQENLQPSDALVFCLKGIMKSWNKYKILNDPDQLGAIVTLLDHESKIGRKKLYESKELQQFAEWTGYKIPRTDKTFQNDMTTFRGHLNLKRKRDCTYSRQQLQEAAARALKKGFKGKR